jgi:hypothetical protein
MRLRRRVAYQWRLREVMATRGLFTTTELVPLLAERGITLSASGEPQLPPEQYERWHVRPCARCGRRAAKTANWPDGPICRTCHDRAARTRGRCPGCQVERVLPGRRDDGTPICRDCAGITRSFFCDRCGFEGLLCRAPATRTLGSCASSASGTSSQAARQSQAPTPHPGDAAVRRRAVHPGPALPGLGRCAWPPPGRAPPGRRRRLARHPP